METANLTFIIGNGFDLSCGLKTSFKDMYPSYIKIPSDNEVIARFKNNIKEDKNLQFEHWSDFEMGMAKYANNWDSENDMLDCLEDFSAHMVQHIEDEQFQFLDRLKGTAIIAASRQFVQSVQSFYLALPHREVERQIRTMMDGIISINFLNFNYTSVLNRLINEAAPSANSKGIQLKNYPIRIHGDLSGPVLGVDNDQQFESIRFPLSISGKRAFIKPYFNSENDPTKLRSAFSVINNSDIICVFGKRFGKSDKTWNQAILEWLLADSSHILVYCDHSCSRFYPSIPGRKLDKEDEIKERLIQELEGSKEVLPQIHVPVGKTLFDIASAIQEAEEFDERNRKRSTLDVR